MSLPRIVDHDEWLAARTELLAKEKELTRPRDALNVERRNLPMEEIEKDYVLHGPQGEVGLRRPVRRSSSAHRLPLHVRPGVGGGLPELHRGHGRDLRRRSSSTSHVRDTSYALVSRAPLEKLERWKALQGWDLPWYSSNGSDFNLDFGVTIDESVGADTYNYRDRAGYEANGEDFFSSPQPFEMPGRSCFLTVDGRVFHTYSQYARGLESTGGSYYFLDLTALGRQEEWEEPKGRSESVRSAQPNFAS